MKRLWRQFCQSLALAPAADRSANCFLLLCPPLPPGLSSLTDLDILVYYVPWGKSVVTKLVKINVSPIAGHNGFTAGASPRASEVYVQYDPTLNAKLTFHEIMHMKLRMGYEMHCLNNCCKPGNSPCGLAAADITNEGLTDDNIKRMVTALRTPVKQWTGGIPILAQVRDAMRRGDTMSGLWQ